MEGYICQGAFHRRKLPLKKEIAWLIIVMNEELIILEHCKPTETSFYNLI